MTTDDSSHSARIARLPTFFADWYAPLSILFLFTHIGSCRGIMFPARQSIRLFYGKASWTEVVERGCQMPIRMRVLEASRIIPLGFNAFFLVLFVGNFPTTSYGSTEYHLRNLGCHVVCARDV